MLYILCYSWLIELLTATFYLFVAVNRYTKVGKT